MCISLFCVFGMGEHWVAQPIHSLWRCTQIFLWVECAHSCLLIGFVLSINCSDAPTPLHFFAQMPPRPPPELIHLVTSFPELGFCVVVTLKDVPYIYLEKLLSCPPPTFFAEMPRSTYCTDDPSYVFSWDAIYFDVSPPLCRLEVEDPW